MKHINNQSNLQKSNLNRPIATPSLVSGQKGVVIKPMPILNSFVKSNGTIGLGSRVTGIYKLKSFKVEEMDKTKSWLTLDYKIKKTKYKITSCTYTVATKSRSETTEGDIEISKGLFNTKVFKLKDLPKNVIDSINENINLFNQEWNNQVILNQVNQKEVEDTKKNSFFNGLDV